MQRIAIIDIGSNSARLVISHIYKNGAYNMVYNQKEALRLSQKVDEKNMLTEVAFSSTIETMKSFAYMCKIYQADKTIAVATAAIRNAANGAELVARVAEETGIQLHIISCPSARSIPPPCSIPVTSCPPMFSVMSASLS